MSYVRSMSYARSTSARSALLPTIATAALVLGACGSDEGPAADTADVETSTGGLRAPVPIRVGSEGAGSKVAGSGVAASSLSADAEASLLPVGAIEYVLGDVGELPANTTGYVFPAGVTVAADRVAAVAAALGVDGEPVAGGADTGASWQVGPVDGSGASLTVGADAQLGWWYNAGSEVAAVDMAVCSVSLDSDGNEVDSCDDPEPPAGVPTAAEAEAKARELLAALGEDPAALSIETTADEWYATVHAALPLDGVDSPVGWDLSFGAEGVLQWASGTFARPEPVGPYELVGLDEAFARLQEQATAWAVGGPAVDVLRSTGAEIAPADPGVPPVAVPVVPEAANPVEPAVTEPTEPTEPAVDRPEGDVATAPEPVPAPAPMPAPTEPAPAPEPVTVTLTGVEADVWWVWDVDGAIWLLPAYRFIDTDGGWHVVPAVTDEYLVEQEPPATTAPVETAPVERIPVETIPGDTAPGDAGPAGTVPADLAALVGLPVDEFTARAEALGFTTRVTTLDGEPQMGTMDLRTDRVNVAVADGTVTAIDSIG